jgi:hypothetical protein
VTKSHAFCSQCIIQIRFPGRLRTAAQHDKFVCFCPKGADKWEPPEISAFRRQLGYLIFVRDNVEIWLKLESWRLGGSFYI